MPYIIIDEQHPSNVEFPELQDLCLHLLEPSVREASSCRLSNKLNKYEYFLPYWCICIICSFTSWARALVQWFKLPAWKVGDRGFEPRSGSLVLKKQNESSLLTREDLIS